MPKQEYCEAYNAKRREQRRLARLERGEQERLKATNLRERNRKNQANSRAKKKNMSANENEIGVTAEVQALLEAKKKAVVDDEAINAAEDARLFAYFKERRTQQEEARKRKFDPIDKRFDVDTEIRRDRNKRKNEEHEMRQAQSARKAAESEAKINYWNEKAKTERKMRESAALAETQRQPFIGMPVNNEGPTVDTPDREVPDDGNDSPIMTPIPIPRLPETPASKTGLFGSLGRIFSGNKNPIDKDDSSPAPRVVGTPEPVDNPEPEPPVTPHPKRNKVTFGTNTTHQFDPTKVIRPDKTGTTVIYNQAVLNEWDAYSDEEIITKFTKRRLTQLFEEGKDGHLKVRQVLYVVKNKGLLRNLEHDPLRYANSVAFPEANMGWGRHFKSLSPVRRQIMSRLDKDLKVRMRLFREDLANQASDEESEDEDDLSSSLNEDSSSSSSINDATEDMPSEMEA